jgi:hypothetical protein
MRNKTKLALVPVLAILAVYTNNYRVGMLHEAKITEWEFLSRVYSLFLDGDYVSYVPGILFVLVPLFCGVACFGLTWHLMGKLQD